MYRSYGLNIDSDIPLLGLPEIDVDADDDGTVVDVRVIRGHVDRPPGAFVDGRLFDATATDAVLCWEGVGAFRVSQGQEICVDPEPGTADAVTRLFVGGACMGVVMHQREHLVLHASAVEVAGAAVSFIGHKGYGKSTTAAAISQRGHAVITDDVLVFKKHWGERPTVLPGSSLLKLWPGAVEAALGEDPADLPQLVPDVPKRARIVERSSDATVPLSHMFVLDVGKKFESSVLSKRDAFLEILRHSYGPRFVGTGGTPPEHFEYCTRLAQQIPVIRLRRKPDVSLINYVVDEIIKICLA